jgi:hypothetical protein
VSFHCCFFTSITRSLHIFNQAELLRLGGADVKISFLELIDNNIGPRGANALGMSLSFGHNLSLLTLKLDYNPTLGDEGVINLCKGLRTNATLKQLHLQFCNITSKSGPALAEFLANSKSSVELFNMSGNRLGGEGLASLCKGLIYNTKCETLCLADNMIDQVSRLREHICSLAAALCYSMSLFLVQFNVDNTCRWRKISGGWPRLRSV